MGEGALKAYRTLLHPTIPYRTLLYPTVPYAILPDPTVRYRTVPCRAVRAVRYGTVRPYDRTSYRTVP